MLIADHEMTVLSSNCQKIITFIGFGSQEGCRITTDIETYTTNSKSACPY